MEFTVLRNSRSKLRDKRMPSHLVLSQQKNPVETLTPFRFDQKKTQFNCARERQDTSDISNRRGSAICSQQRNGKWQDDNCSHSRKSLSRWQKPISAVMTTPCLSLLRDYEFGPHSVYSKSEYKQILVTEVYSVIKRRA